MCMCSEIRKSYMVQSVQTISSRSSLMPPKSPLRIKDPFLQWLHMTIKRCVKWEMPLTIDETNQWFNLTGKSNHVIGEVCCQIHLAIYRVWEVTSLDGSVVTRKRWNLQSPTTSGNGSEKGRSFIFTLLIPAPVNGTRSCSSTWFGIIFTWIVNSQSAPTIVWKGLILQRVVVLIPGKCSTNFNKIYATVIV